MRVLFGVLLVVFILLQVALWGKHGLPDLWELYHLNLSGENKNNDLLMRNRELERKISEIKSGLDEIEKEAREELGMVKQGETFFRVIERTSEVTRSGDPFADD